MFLCLDVGNSQIFGGIYDGEHFVHKFRFNSKQAWSSDLLGMNLKMYCREHDIESVDVDAVLVCSVVPSLDHHIKNASLKYFKQDPFFIKAGVKTGISVSKFKSPTEIGADIIAGCVAVCDKYPKKNCIIVDLGTATTICAINDKKEFLGGVIISGVKTQLDSITIAAEKLFTVEIEKPEKCIGLNTTHSMQSGAYFGHLGSLKEIIKRISNECFAGKKTKVIGTGGFAKIFGGESLIDHIESELVLNGLVKIFKLNS